MATMVILTAEKYKNLCQEDSYWLGRWGYLSEVVEMIKRINPVTVLEIGAYKNTVVEGCDSMDISYSPTYLWDATKTPFPIEDKKYDLVIALQVIEHLVPNQREVFNEIERISKEAIISLPYKWIRNCPKDNCHFNIDEKKIEGWANGRPYVSKKIIEDKNGTQSRERIIYHFKF